MALKQIEIVKKNKNGKTVAGPKGGDVTEAKKGDRVIFTIPPNAERKDSSITFDNGSPFGSEQVSYGTPLTVAADEGRFTYSCKLKIDGELIQTDSGGEMQIIQE
jgi:hypothetical protein